MIFTLEYSLLGQQAWKFFFYFSKNMGRLDRDGLIRKSVKSFEVLLGNNGSVH